MSKCKYCGAKPHEEGLHHANTCRRYKIVLPNTSLLSKDRPSPFENLSNKEIRQISREFTKESFIKINKDIGNTW